MERNVMSYTDLVVMDFNGEILDWCFKEGLIARFAYCKECARPMDLNPRRNRNDRVEWICRGEGPSHVCYQSIRSNSWFAGSRLSIAHILKLTLLWLKKCSFSFVSSDLKLSTRTVHEWRRCCREVCVLDCIWHSDVIGGDGKVVELDESEFGVKVLNKGKQVIGKWVFGGVERGSNKCFFHVVPKTTKHELLEMLKTNVLPGTTVISECFKSNDCLSDEEFVQFSMNSNMHLQDPEISVHTNSMEGTWPAIKRSFRVSHKTRHLYDSFFFEYMWRRRYSDSKDLFREFMQAVRRVYNPE